MPGTYGSENYFAGQTPDFLASTADMVTMTIQLDDTTVDATNPEGAYLLREGLLLGKVTATGNYKQHDPAAADGTEQVSEVVVLMTAINMHDRQANQLVQANALRKGSVYLSKVYGDTTAIVANSAERNNIDFR